MYVYRVYTANGRFLIPNRHAHRFVAFYYSIPLSSMASCIPSFHVRRGLPLFLQTGGGQRKTFLRSSMLVHSIEMTEPF